VLTALKRGTTINRTVKKYGGWIIFVASTIPNPFFDFVGLSAGLTNYPFAKFMILVVAGRVIRAFVASYLGYTLK